MCFPLRQLSFVVTVYVGEFRLAGCPKQATIAAFVDAGSGIVDSTSELHGRSFHHGEVVSFLVVVGVLLVDMVSIPCRTVL